MTALVWQTALLLLGAYFLGAWVACITRRIFFSVTTVATKPVGIAEPAEAMAGQAPAPVRLAEQEPVSPQIDVISPAPGPRPVDNAERFQRALTGEGMARTGELAEAAVPAAALPSEAVNEHRLSPADAAGAAALAAAAAGQSASARIAPGQPLVLPAAAGATGQSSTSAPVAWASAAATSADDLTLIQSIDHALQSRLHQHGVRRFQDIAEWKAAEVERIGAALGQEGRIQRENWIEQAQILARGGDTAFSSRVKRGERPAAAPSADEGEARTYAAPVVVAAPASSANLSAAAAGLAAAAASAAALPQRRTVIGLGRDNLQRISQISAELEKQLNFQGVSRYDQIASWSGADTSRFDKLLGSEGRIARENWIEQAQILARGGETAYSREFDRRAAETTGETLRPARLAEAIRSSGKSEPDAKRRPDVAALRSVRSEALRGGDASQATGSRPLRTPGIDDLKRIRGIGVLIERKLNGMGISTYEQIANWTSADVDRVSGVLDFKGRIERENWVEQARILASGGQTEFARRVERGEVETSRSRS